MPLSKLIKEFKPYRWQVVLVILLGIVVAAIQPLSLKISQEIVDRLKAGVDPKKFQWLPLVLIPLFFVSGIAKYFYNTLRRVLTENVIQKYRSALFEKYLEFPVSYLERQQSGDLLSKIQNDLANVREGIDTLCTVAKEPFTFLGLIGMAFYFDWKLALCVFVVAPPVVLLFSKSGGAVKKYSDSNLKQFSNLTSIVQESLSGSRVIKIFNLKKALLEKFTIIQRDYLKTLTRSIRIQEIATPAVEFVGAILMSLIFVYAAYRISSGSISFGDLLAFIFTLGLAQMPIKQLNLAYLKIKMAEAALERVYEVLETPSEQNWVPTLSAPLFFGKEIAFKNVSLSYGDKKALQNISITIPMGSSVAFVGPSGSGKSSLMHLLPRLICPTQGEILLDGQNIQDMPLTAVRSLISMVNQETFLFHDTILENIRYGKLEATEKEIVQAAEHAHCLDFIDKAPLGFQTVVGERGYSLSGGERQRIAIARAFLKGAPILILDEATSNLDSQSEVIVQDALEGLMENKTTLIVTHRQSTLRQAQTIYVLKNGNLEQMGLQKDLLDQTGLFSDMFKQISSGLEGPLSS